MSSPKSPICAPVTLFSTVEFCEVEVCAFENAEINKIPDNKIVYFIYFLKFFSLIEVFSEILTNVKF